MLCISISQKDFEQIVDEVIKDHTYNGMIDVKELIINPTYYWLAEIGEDLPYISCSIYSLIGDICGSIRHMDAEGITYASILEGLYNKLLPLCEVNPYL